MKARPPHTRAHEQARRATSKSREGGTRASCKHPPSSGPNRHDEHPAVEREAITTNGHFAMSCMPASLR
eukprot:7223231-Lingulodinium_polyedra.AAC.1